MNQNWKVAETGWNLRSVGRCKILGVLMTFVTHLSCTPEILGVLNTIPYFEKYWGCYSTQSTPSSVASEISLFQPSDFKENLTNMRRIDYWVTQPLLFIMHLLKTLWILIPRFTLWDLFRKQKCTSKGGQTIIKSSALLFFFEGQDRSILELLNIVLNFPTHVMKVPT